MANKNAKRNDGIVTIVSLLLTILFIILSVISETKWIFIILAIISGLVLLVMLFGAMHLRSTKKPTKYVSFSSSSSYSSNSSSYTKPKSALEQQIESELKYLSKEEQTYWKAYHDAQIKGYRFFQNSKTPLDWKERVWGQLTTYQQLHYLEVVKHDIKLGKKMQWQEDHQGLMKAKRALSYVVNLEFLDPIYEKLGNLSSGNTTIEKKDSPSIAARDIKRILNSSGSYSDGVNGTCKYYIRNISADKYSRIVIDVEMTDYSLSDVGSSSSLKLNLKEEIREAAYTESGGYVLAVTVY